jgi:hypothetical protein
LQGFRSKIGRPFAAILRITRDEEIKNFKQEFDFGQNQNGDDPVQADFTGQESLGSCPKCGGSVYEQGMNYICENTPPKKCDFRSGKVILRQEIALREHCIASGGQENSPGRTPHELQPDGFLEVSDGAADRNLGHTVGPGSGRKAIEFDNSRENGELRCGP